MNRYLFLLMFFISSYGFAGSNCVGKFVNPITDVCWECLFPISLGNITVADGKLPDSENSSSLICTCSDPFPRIGINIGYWEPVRLVDVTRKPFCMVNLAGVSLNIGKYWSEGTVAANTKHQSGGFYDVHWYLYPLIYWMELLTDALCLEKSQFDIAYLTELDPLWRDDELTFILNPEAVLFGNPVAQASCAADCVKASTGLPTNKLFWCAGCQGSMYPLDGWIQDHIGGVQGSVLLLERMTYKLHREYILWGTSSKNGETVCSTYPMPVMQKTQYRYQMTYPVAATHSTSGCQPYGRTTSVWGSARTYPVKGEDFGYLIWRKRNCCAA